MISFPVCEQLQIDGYGLYPGLHKDHKLDLSFGHGLTLILGANGLGKTTLISILFRMMTGPFDIRSSSGDSLGTTAINAAELSSARRQGFARRVRDGAEKATGTLEFTLGETRLKLSRSLANLRLVNLEVNGEIRKGADEEAYQRTVYKAAGVHSFGDFLLLLRHLTFLFEDRRSLVWDSAAQRQILRALFLNPDDAKLWSELERKALSLDSELRNTNALMTRTEAQTKDAVHKVGNASDVRAQIETRSALQAKDTGRQDLLGERAGELDALLTQYRLDVLRAEQQADAAKRAVEHAQLSAIERSFPSIDDSMRYIFAQLSGDGFCRACGQESEAAVERMRNNLEKHLCAICDLPLPESGVVAPGKVVLERIEQAKNEAHLAQVQLRAKQRAYREVGDEYRQVQTELAEISAAINQRHRELTSLYHQLPPEESALQSQEGVLRGLQVRVESLKSQLGQEQAKFQEFVEAKTKSLQKISAQLKAIFDGYASGFLLEQIALTWAPVQERLGVYTGNPFIEFPAFRLDVTGSDFTEPVRRAGPGQVSESQREFIDLAFRMALIAVAGVDGAGTIVIDAPESSLDAVFVGRAAHVLGRFALASPGTRLVVTSNLLPGELLPELIQMSTAKEKQPKIFDLFEEGRRPH
jgi:AAA domain